MVNFDFGTLDKEYSSLYFKENMLDRTYLKHNQVKKGDVVLDIGANVGTFSYSVIQSKPSHIYCVEPNKEYFNALVNNMAGKPATLINKGIDDSYSIQDLFKDHNIDFVDFMKVDCEGCENLIFTEQNQLFIKSRVKYVVGEYHFCFHKDSVKNWIDFRNFYMLNCKNVWLYQRDDTHVTREFYNDDWFVRFKKYWDTVNPYIGQIIFYIEL